MAIYIGSQKPKFYIGSQKVKAIWLGGVKVYSSGNIVTYNVDTGITYQEEVDEGASCLSPKTFTPAKSGWTFLGWRSDASANASVYQSLVMGDSPVTLYAVFTQSVVLSTYVSGSLSQYPKTRVYNNGNISNPVFTVSTPSLSGANWLGWCNSAGTVLYSSISNLTLSATTVLYSGFKYNDITAVSNAVIKCPGTVGRNTTYTIANIPSTHLTHTITGKVPDFFVGNPTTGYGLGVVSVNGQSVRIKSCTQGGNNQTEGWIPEINNGNYGSRELPGSYGKTFTLSGSGSPTVYFQFGDYTGGELNVTQVVFHGKTVIG